MIVKQLWHAPKAIGVGLAVAGVCAVVFLLWHVILLVLLGVVAWRVLLRGHRRPSRIPKWIEAGSLAAIAYHTRGMAPLKKGQTPPVEKPKLYSQAGDDDPWPKESY